MTFVAVGNNGSFVACQDCLGSDNDITIIAGARLHAPILPTRTNFWKSLNFSLPSLVPSTNRFDIETVDSRQGQRNDKIILKLKYDKY